MRKAYFVPLLAVLAFAAPARAVILLSLRDEFDERKVVRQIRNRDTRVKSLNRNLDVLRKRLLRLKQRDFIALFGSKVDKPAKTYALPCFEWRGIALSGLVPVDPKKCRRHTDFYTVSDFAGMEVYYGNDGESPMTWVLYFKVSEDFTSLKTAADLTKRLAWDRARWEFFKAWLEHRMALVFPYEVDMAAMPRLSSREELLGVPERRRAWSWYDETKHSIRHEWDDNGNGIPDWVAKKFDMAGKGRRPLKPDESWAIHPELVPKMARTLGRFQPRLIIRRKPEPKPLPPPPWARRMAAAPDDSRGASSSSAAERSTDDGPGILVATLGLLAGALALALASALVWRRRRGRRVRGETDRRSSP